MVKVIEIFEDDEHDDDEDIIVFDHTPCGMAMHAENMPGPPVSKRFVNNHKSKRYW